jgi:hypothetical protein
MLVTERLPLAEIVDLAADLTTGYAVVEFVSPEDSMFCVLERGRDELYSYLNASISSEAHQRGYNVSVSGWHIPYGRWFPGLLADCAWWSRPSEFNSTGTTFFQSARRKPMSLFETGDYSPFGHSLTAKRMTRLYFEFMQHSRDALGNPAIGFLFLHVPFPHPVHTYNRFTGRFDGPAAPVEGYANSLALVDRILSELRDVMERDGTWEGAAVVLSADHPNVFAPSSSPKSDQRVPFLLKLPGKQPTAVFPNRLNTIMTADLLLNVMETARLQPCKRSPPGWASTVTTRKSRYRLILNRRGNVGSTLG